MITKKTVLVLGAGASHPYGLPLGYQLRERLWNRPTGMSGTEFELALGQIGKTPAAHQEFMQAFRRSSVNSIDEWLSINSHYEAIGKLCIAAEICANEQPSLFNSANRDDDWYHYLWNAMLRGIHGADALGDVPLRIITFNYDRSFEAFLASAIEHTYSLSDEEAQTVFERFEHSSILHVYGSVGRYSLLKDATGPDWVPRVTYSPDLDWRKLKQALSGLRIMHQGRADDTGFEKARQWLAWADDIIFLGFHFDPLNVERLAIPDVMQLRIAGGSLPSIYASAYDRTLAERDHIFNLMCNRGGTIQFADVQSRCLATLRSFHVLH